MVEHGEPGVLSSGIETVDTQTTEAANLGRLRAMVARNLAGGLLVAVLLAVPFVVPVIAGIDTWKYLLGAIGLWIFVRAGMSRPSPP